MVTYFSPMASSDVTIEKEMILRYGFHRYVAKSHELESLRNKTFQLAEKSFHIFKDTSFFRK